MSYDVYLEIDTGGPHPQRVVDCGNYTYNCAGMLVDACGSSLNDLDKSVCGQVWVLLEHAIAKLRANPEKYRAMNPKNGWGNYDAWVVYLTNIANECRDNPKCVLRVQ